MEGSITVPRSKSRKSEHNPKIVVNDVYVALGGRDILEAVDLKVLPHEILCLIGASGCGKTTLLNVIAGLIQPSSGSATMDDRIIIGPGPERVMVFQEDAVFPWLRVSKNVEYGLRAIGVPRAERESRARKAIDTVGLTGRENAFPRELSGGMRKRVDLARALAVEPEVVLMDEPYAALDAITKDKLQVEFVHIAEAALMTTVFVTHDLEEALFLGDRVVVMAGSRGRIEEVVEVPFPRPRETKLKRTAPFQELRGILTEAIEGSAR
ncbi:MAG: ABC transporter ATP-binding protein [Armatimonadetes bacterium]|nr:ABC transporter ATP-binding protein [Armatimonadota bacterium]